jgi:hypothetical protein
MLIGKKSFGWGEPDFKTYNFETLKEWCGLTVPDGKEKIKSGGGSLRRNFTSRQKYILLDYLNDMDNNN